MVVFSLATLMSAALELPNCCIVVANLSGSYQAQTKALADAISNLQQETRRQAMTVTPVQLAGNEIYEILKTRLIDKMPDERVIADVAEEYAQQVKKAEDAGYVVAASIEQIAEQVRETYPFHPSFKHLVALFKENEGFRQNIALPPVCGTVMSLRGTASGLLFAVYLKPEQVLDALAAEGGGARPRRIDADLARQLDEVRSQGLGRAVHALLPGVSAMAAPVFDERGAIALSLTAIGPNAVFDARYDGRVADARLRARRPVASAPRARAARRLTLRPERPPRPALLARVEERFAGGVLGRAAAHLGRVAGQRGGVAAECRSQRARGGAGHRDAAQHAVAGQGIEGERGVADGQPSRAVELIQR